MNVTPQEWILTLKIAADSQDPESEVGIPRQYIVAKGKTYSTADRTQINLSTPKLTLHKIVDISQTKSKEMREGFLKDEISETEYLNLTNDLEDYTSKLIDARDAKRNHLINKCLRKMALILSALFSFVLIGIPFFLKLRQEDRKFYAESDQLRQMVFQIKKANSEAMLAKKLDHLPSMLESIKKRFRDHRREELIREQMIADWRDYEKIPVNLRPPYYEEFERDIKRGVSFIRIDKVMNIEDQKPIPFLYTDSDRRVKEAFDSLQQLLQSSADQHWTPILQIAITRASLDTAFRAALSAFNVDAARIQWEENGIYYSIKSVLSHQSSPVILEVIRHPKNKTIEKVHVTVKGSIDIVSYNTTSPEDQKLIVPTAIIEELKYSIAFEDNSPVIYDVHSQMQAESSVLTKSQQTK